MREMRSQRCAAALGAFAFSIATSVSAADTTIDLSGEVPDGPERHFSLEFDVPAGTKEIAVHQQSLNSDNILDFGIMDSTGAWRGWGGSRIVDAIVGEQAATRSHVPGPIPAGKWQIVVGEAAVRQTPALFTLVVTLRDAPTLPPQAERKPYAPPAPIETNARWYAGDFHVHSMESNDAQPALDTVATFAKSRGLDFVLLSDHNIHTQLDYYADAHEKHPGFLFLPGVEYTTYWGHANAIGATQWVDDRTELPGKGIELAVQQYDAQGALFSINHPELRVGDACIGCGWDHDLPVDQIDAVEIGTGKFGLFNDDAITFWDSLCDQGRHVAPLGGSDDHKAGVDPGALGSPIGNPTTLVFASELSVAGIMDGIRAGRTVVKLEGPDDPMVELGSSVEPEGDTISADSARLTATITGGVGYAARWVKNGEAMPEVEITTDPFVLEMDVTAPSSGEDRYRAETLKSSGRRTVTSHLWLKSGSDVNLEPSGGGGCGCTVAPRPVFGLSATCLALLAYLLRKRRQRPG